MNSVRSLISQTAIYGLSSIVGRFLNYLLVPLYTNIFSPSEYGVVTELYAYSSFLLIIFTYGMETAFFRFVQEESHASKVYPTALFSILSSSFVFLLIFGFSIPSLSKVLHYEQQSYLLWLLLLIIITDSIAAIPFAYLRQQNKAWKFAFIKIINISVNIISNLVFLLLFPYLSAKGVHLGWIYNHSLGVGYVFISNLLANVVTLFMLSPSLLVPLTVDVKLLRMMLMYSLPLLIAGLAGMVNETFDRAMLKYLVTDKDSAMYQLGIYGANYKISVLMTLFIQTFRYAAEPFFFNKAKEKNAKELYATVMKYFILFGLFIFLLVMLYLHFVQYFIGKEFRVGLHIVPILLMANLFLGIFFNLSIWYKITNKTRYGAILTVFGAIVTIVLNVLLIPIMGYEGAAWTTLICYVSMAIFSYWLGQRHFPVPYPVKEIFFYTALSLLIFFVSNFVKIDAVWLKTMFNSVLLLMFVAVVYVKERRNILKIL